MPFQNVQTLSNLVVTISTTSLALRNCIFPHNVFMYFILFPQQMPVIFLNVVYGLVFLLETELVCWESWPKILYTVWCNTIYTLPLVSSAVAPFTWTRVLKRSKGSFFDECCLILSQFGISIWHDYSFRHLVEALGRILAHRTTSAWAGQQRH